MKVYIHGNCQSTVVKNMLQEVDFNFEVKSREVHVIKLDTEINDYVSDIRGADIIIAQPVGRNYRNEERLSVEWIRENKKPNAVVLTVIPLYFLGYVPSQGYIREDDGREVQALKMPYHDYHLFDYYNKGISVEQVIKNLADPQFFGSDFLQHETNKSIKESYRREEIHQPDVRLTKFIEENYKSKYLFFTFNHPTRTMFVPYVDEILRLLDVKARVSHEGPEYLDTVIVSPYRSVLSNYGLDIGSYENKIKGSTIQFDRNDYIERLFKLYDERIGREKANKLAGINAPFQSYIDRFYKSR